MQNKYDLNMDGFGEESNIQKLTINNTTEAKHLNYSYSIYWDLFLLFLFGILAFGAFTICKYYITQDVITKDTQLILTLSDKLYKAKPLIPKNTQINTTTILQMNLVPYKSIVDNTIYSSL